MPRPKKIDRPHRLSLYVPESVYARLERRLWSDLEGRIPFGKVNDTIVGLITDWLAKDDGAVYLSATVPIDDFKKGVELL